MTSQHYFAHYVVKDDRIDEDRMMAILEDLVGYSASVSANPAGGEISIRIAFPADSYQQAARTGIDVVLSALIRTDPRPSGSGAAQVDFGEVMTEAEFNRREGFEDIPELLSVTQVAELYSISRQAILKMIDRGHFATATRIGEGWAIGYTEAHAKRPRTVDEAKEAIARGATVKPYEAKL